MTQEGAINIIKKFLKILKTEGLKIDKAYLYGSYAKGNANEESDIDVLLVSKEFDNADDYKLSSPWKYTTRADHRIEPYSIGLNRFQNDTETPIIEIVKREGVEIVID